MKSYFEADSRNVLVKIHAVNRQDAQVIKCAFDCARRYVDDSHMQQYLTDEDEQYEKTWNQRQHPWSDYGDI